MSDPIKKKEKAIIKNYLDKGIDTKNFKKFDVRNDTIIQGKSIDQSLAFKKESFNRRNAALSLNGTTSAGSSGSYANPKEQRTTKNTSTGEYKVSSVYNKEELKNTMTPLNQQKLSPGARARKAERDLLFAKTPARKAKKAHAQRERRKNPTAAKGKDFDHKDQRWETPSKNRSNDGQGTKKESGKKYKTK